LCVIEDSDIVIWKGKNYRDYKGLRGIFRIATLIILGYVSVVLNNNVYCINASIWRMKNRLQKRLLNFVLKKCKHVTVRDEDSLVHFNDFDVKNYSYCADLSFYDLKENYSKYFCAGFSNRKQYDVALTLTQWGNESLQNAYINYLVEFLCDLKKNQRCESIVIIPQVNRTSESNDKVKKLLIKRLNEKTNVVITDIPMVINVDELLKLYSVSKILIGTRMHSCVFSFFVGTPFIGIAYDNGPKWSILRKIWPRELILDYELLKAPKTFNFDFFDLVYCRNQFELMYNSSFLNVSEID
jgi:colanic acid/amylovoran biosynthesis protein